MARRRSDVIPVHALRRRSSRTILAEIRRLYFSAKRETIDRDLARALELLKSLPDEAEREKATVYMHGLAEMRRDWKSRKVKSGK